jgi:hypothetical protein
MSRSVHAHVQHLPADPDATRGAVDEVEVRWRGWMPAEDSDDDEDGPPRMEPGRETALLIRLAVGPARGDRRRVLLSAWTAPTYLDREDMTEVGMVVDDGNQADLVLGEKTVLKLPIVQTRCCDNPCCRERHELPVVVFAEWHPVKRATVRYTFVPGQGVSRMTVTELSSEIVNGVAFANAAKPGYVPELPPALAAPKTPFEACADAAEKRRKKQAAESAAAADAPAAGEDEDADEDEDGDSGSDDERRAS